MQPLACFFGRRKTSEAGQYRRGWLAKRSARLSFLSKRIRPAAQDLLACFFGREKTSNAGPVRSEKARQSNALACLFYLKERAGHKHGVGSGNKKSPAISDGGFGGICYLIVAMIQTTANRTTPMPNRIKYKLTMGFPPFFDALLGYLH